jgi:hypothetical protein
MIEAVSTSEASKLLSDCTAQHHRTQSSSISPRRENLKSHSTVGSVYPMKLIKRR